ncbi:hypothetical protein Taro_033007 [Colocasia esculenta]|uniref:BHLH domain-containing protein n=1 Tax=Colocasia esculenta TaxID=4460 RepID=A0A843VU58_COLES|nr:hypothetical protein [Colocasia esculenta]
MRVEELAGTTTTSSSMSGCKGVPRSVEDPSSFVIASEQFSEGDWNPFASLDQHLDFYAPTNLSPYTPGVQENQWMISSSNGCPVKQVPGLQVSGVEKIMTPLVLPEEDEQIAGSPVRTGSLLSEEEQGGGKKPRGKKRRRTPEHGAFDPLSSFNRIQTINAEHKKDVEKEKGEQVPGATAHKSASDQAKDNSSSGDDHKEGYVNLPAKRGRAMNSHSLAERVRREKISQRMKFLQDLVPGCSKITGKAVMLDEIINYVQSLQQQVEFLSMKLATVNPEMQLHPEQVLSPDVLYSQTGNSGVPVIGTGSNYSHFHFQGANQQGAWQAQTSPSVWDGDLQNAKNMDLVSNAHIDATIESPVERNEG